MSHSLHTPSVTTTPGQHEGGEEEARIRRVLVVSYWGLVPLVVVVGVAVNALGLHLLNTPRLRARPATAYLKLLLSLDVAVLLVTLATIITLNGCHLHSYAEARYFAHPSFTAFYSLQTFCHYVVVWLCYDRFLALWSFRRFQQTQQPGVMRVRILLTGLFCVLMNLRHLFDVTVVCMSGVGVVEAVSSRDSCEGGAWVILDTLHQRERQKAWQSVAWVVRGLLVIVMPVLLVLIFNSAIVIGLIRRRLYNISATTRTRDQAFSSIYISLAISVTSVATAIPTVVHAYFYAANIQHCHGSLREEVFRATANLLLVGEHLTHILFLAINHTFRHELRALLHRTKRHLTNALTRIAHTVCLSRPTNHNTNVCLSRPRTHNSKGTTKAPINISRGLQGTPTDTINISSSRQGTLKAHHTFSTGPQVPSLAVWAPEDQPDGGVSVRVMVPPPASLTTTLQGDPGQGKDSCHLQEPELSDCASVLTQEEEV